MVIFIVKDSLLFISIVIIEKAFGGKKEREFRNEDKSSQSTQQLVKYTKQ